MRDVIEKRFGLKGGSAKTLQAIGREYKITRERVRQIEADALRHLRKEDYLTQLAPVFKAIEEYMEAHGHVMGEQHLLTQLTDARSHSHALLLLGISRAFTRLPETDYHSPRWATDVGVASAAERAIGIMVDRLEGKKAAVSQEDLRKIAHECIREAIGKEPSDAVIDSYLNASKVIGKNPYGEYGLAWWPSINPSGVKDKAYVAIAKASGPLHFREVAEAINRAGWSKKKAHPQTVHNELIKDKRFVLVGRGLYALKEWGYEPGAVRDVIVSVLKETHRPMAKEEIVASVAKKRLVKVPTIFLNLQNKKLFTRTDDGMYTLA